ncbi:serine hydrolase [Geotalea uraniireducens]|nr:serine hydrolase [Geotalea uraniireducens]
MSVLLLGAGWHAHGWYHRHFHSAAHRRVRLTGYRFISPLVDVELPEGYGVRQEPIPFKRKIKDFVQWQIDNGRVRNLSVYYRDLSDGPWFGINEKVEYNPASMMKVPVMIAWLELAEKDPRVLKQTFVFDGKENLSALQTIRPAQTITPGRAYTVEELLRYMISYSDNNATSLLYEGLSAAELEDVLLSMDIDNHPKDDRNSLTVHGFSGFFRVLYNASYLNRNMSEKALQLLSQEDFPQGIVGGVPKGIVVASKFGECNDVLPGEDKQLHEFGIVYHPKGPYILGIMTGGHDLALQAEVIRDISARIYAEVDASLPAKGGSPAKVEPGQK